MRVALALLACVWALACNAHPLGNNTVNREAAITLGGQSIRIDYRVELAEIPTLVASQDADVDGNGAISADEWQAYAQAWVAALREALQVRDDHGARPLSAGAVDWQLEDGAAGLKQLRLHVELSASAPPGRARLRYSDDWRPDQPGWREVWAQAGAGARLIASNVAASDRSAGLTRFPPVGGALPDEHGAQLEAEFDGQADGLSATAPAALTSHPVTARAAGLRALFLLGVHHIATGWDHLVFLLGLVLLSRSLRALLAVVSAFTLAHSLTLGLAAAGLVTPPGSLVEPAIALSIAYVGWCNLYRRQRAHGMALAFGFGLIHGFGFAGALAETLGTQRLDGHGWLLELAAFNLGIESVQVALLCMVVPALRAGARLSWATSARRGAAHGVMWAGLAWFAWRVASL